MSKADIKLVNGVGNKVLIDNQDLTKHLTDINIKKSGNEPPKIDLSVRVSEAILNLDGDVSFNIGQLFMTDDFKLKLYYILQEELKSKGYNID